VQGHPVLGLAVVVALSSGRGGIRGTGGGQE